METYEVFAVRIVNEIITEEIEFSPKEPVIKYQSRGDLNDKEAPKG